MIRSIIFAVVIFSGHVYCLLKHHTIDNRTLVEPLKGDPRGAPGGRSVRLEDLSQLLRH